MDESKNLTDICSQKLMDLREEVRSILTNSGHCDPIDLYPHLEKGNQDQIVILNMILEWMYPNGRRTILLLDLPIILHKTKILQMSYQTCHLILRVLKMKPQRMT